MVVWGVAGIVSLAQYRILWSTSAPVLPMQLCILEDRVKAIGRGSTVTGLHDGRGALYILRTYFVHTSYILHL